MRLAGFAQTLALSWRGCFIVILVVSFIVVADDAVSTMCLYVYLTVLYVLYVCVCI